MHTKVSATNHSDTRRECQPGPSIFDSDAFIADGRWAALSRQLGKRYEDCTLRNFECPTAAHRAVRDTMQEFIDGIRQRRNLLLYGGCGAGKDHLATAAARAAIESGAYVVWRNALDLFAQIRDGFQASVESSAIEPLIEAKAGVFYLSDPCVSRDKLTDHQADVLAHIIDRRTRDMRPTWLTVNAKDSKDLERRLGLAVVDRMRENDCCAIHCNLPSYRGRK